MQSGQKSLDSPNRFAFGANWADFLKILDEDRIQESENSLKSMLQVNDLVGKSFLDIGSGSGLSSLSAKRLGAKVFSFDFDPKSVACTMELRRRFFPEDLDWSIERGSALDRSYLDSLGRFDVVYSWGVLHHTGAMWLGIENAIQRVGPGGTFLLAIYNDQEAKSRVWWLIKWLYNKLPWPLNKVYAYSIGGFVLLLNILRYSIRLQPMTAIGPILRRKIRGMNFSHDLVDWVGGFPFEFATYEVLEKYMDARGFKLMNGKKASSLGCHEQVFVRQ